MSKRILFTFAGNTDPTRGGHDGPIIHICRHYSPDKIYLILTKEMEKRDSEPHNILIFILIGYMKLLKR